MKNISIQIDDDLFKEFSIACIESGIQKKTLMINMMREFIENEEDKELLKIAQKRSRRLKQGKAELIDHKNGKHKRNK